jgi:hypothetical protein
VCIACVDNKMSGSVKTPHTNNSLASPSGSRATTPLFLIPPKGAASSFLTPKTIQLSHRPVY